MSLLERIAIVLVEPQNPGNIGMVCRAMKNMGLADLRLVNPCPHQHPEAHMFAVSARDVLDGARLYATLANAVSDCSLTVATTRRHGKYRQEIETPQSVAALLRSHLGANRAALVFGREDHGLTTDEVALCRWHATIPTADQYGSLNLAQAVLLFASEMFQALGEGVTGNEDRTLAATAELEPLYAQMELTLLRIGFLNPDNPAHLMRSLRRIFGRAALDSREVSILRGMMSQIDWAASSFQGKKREGG